MTFRILVQMRSDASNHKGGDYFQALQYCELLKTLGHSVDISFGPREDLGDFDLVHLFNTFRIVETYRQFLHAKKAGVKTVLTPIWHADKYMKRIYRNVYKIPGVLYSLSKPGRELRYCWKNKIKINLAETLKYTAMQKAVFEGVDYVLPNSRAEMDLLKSDLGIEASFFRVIPNTVSEVFHELKRQMERSKRNGILCVGRIEPLKNQLNVLHAYSQGDWLDQPLEFVGKPGSHSGYFKKFMGMVNRIPNIKYSGEKSQSELVEKYLNTRGVIHASHFETTGLIGMEALCCGARISITDNPYTREYYEGHAHFCDPTKIESIREGFRWIAKPEVPGAGYQAASWDEIGLALESVYLEVLGRHAFRG